MSRSPRYNVCIVQPQDFVHALAYVELGELLLHSLQDLGYEAVIQRNNLPPGYRHIVIGAHLLHPDAIAALDAATIFVNTEPMSADTSKWTQPIIDCARRFETWDYSARNVAWFATQGLRHVKLLRLGFQAQLARIAPAATQDIDVLFYGSINDRRKLILQQLEARGLVVHAAYGVYGAERDLLIARAKVVLNLHFYHSKIFEIVRVFYLLTNGVPVVAEVGSATAVDPRYLTGLLACPYGQLVDTCVRAVADATLRQQLRARARTTMAGMPQHLFTAAVLQ